MADDNWEILESRYLLREWWMAVREDAVKLPTGVVLSRFHVVEVPDWVCVVGITAEGKVVLVRQYRHGVGQTVLELPAGGIEDGEAVEDAARREFSEETGYDASEWIALGSLFQDPSRQTNTAYIYAATGLEPGRSNPDPTEQLTIELADASEVLNMIADGRLKHSTHVAAILLAAAHPDLAIHFSAAD
ncbi:MAG: NUDIX hydrolase [Bacteroidetes bacterium]|nr:NUDIX hydrolase [Bacteroidota bacterium]